MADNQSALDQYYVPKARPSTGIRRVQDPEAAKDAPVALARGFVSGVLGAPGDIESIARLLLNIQGPERFVMPRSKEEGMAMLGQIFGANRVGYESVLPTSEDIEKRLPLKVDTPVSNAFTGLGQLGGGFYFGPGAPVRLITGIPQAVVKGGKDFVMAAGQPASRMFIGPKAKTWDQAKADAAARMEKAGVDPVDIWRETGTFRGADGIQRQEISDVGARFLTSPERAETAQVIESGINTLKEKIKPTKQKDLFPKQLTEAKKGVKERIDRAKMELEEYKADPGRGVRAETIISHPELYRAYPELADLSVVTGGYGGEGTRGGLSSLPGAPGQRGWMEMDIYDRGLKADPTSTSLHEMQHAVQTIEGMSPGGSKTFAFNDPRTMEIYKRRMAELQKPPTFEEFQRANRFPADKAARAYEEFVRSYKTNITPDVERAVQEAAAREYYERLAGEAEARATQARQGMTPEQRAQEYPYSSYDVLPEDLLTKPPRQYAGGGALVKAVRAAQSIGKEAPAVVIPSAVTRVQQAAREAKGDYGAKRVQRAADEIKDLEKMYQEEALRQAFLGDNAKAVMTMNPADFEKFALSLNTSAKDLEMANTIPVPYVRGLPDMTQEQYIDYLMRIEGGFADVPRLEIDKLEAGSRDLPFISGHEGRHRSRAIEKAGQPQSLVRLLPRAELREPFPRRSQEEYIEALRKELDLTDRMVTPEKYSSESQRPAILLPEPYAKGGPVGPLSCACEE